LIVSYTRKISKIVLNPQCIFAKTDYLFIFSHMRSRSSVLSHILGSHDKICGYSELHCSYQNSISLLKMRSKISEELQCKIKNKYLLDKLLHNELLFSEKVFKKAKPKIIFLLREPESTIKSIMNMGHITGIDWYKDPEKATDYYCSRLLKLEEYSKQIDDSFFIDSNDLVEDTENLLNTLSNWLHLEKPLEKEYSIFSHTGEAGYGDPSQNIKSGIVKKTEGHPDIEIPLDILQKAISHYIACKDTLMNSSIN